MLSSAPIAFLALAGLAAAKKPTWQYDNLPAKTEPQCQVGTNKCGTKNSQSSLCQTAVANSIDDFCLWGARTPNQDVGVSESSVVAWCLKDGYGTRTIPNGAIKGAHWRQTPDFIQITGTIDWKQLNFNAHSNGGGELDPHGADGFGNPCGGVLFSTAFNGKSELQALEWHAFAEEDKFCLRACNPNRYAPAAFCPHIYDEQGCGFNDPGVYDAKKFDSCAMDSGSPPGLYNPTNKTPAETKGAFKSWSTFQQGQKKTPLAHPAPKSSQCTTFKSIGGAGVAAPTTTKTKTTKTKTKTTSKATKTSTKKSKTSSKKSSTKTSKKASKKTGTKKRVVKSKKAAVAAL